MIVMNDFISDARITFDRTLEAVARVINSGWYVLGREVESFELEWARLSGSEHAIGVANGMDAIEIALRALDIGPGDEVITTPMTAFASVLAILRSGATPVLADIDPQTALLSRESVESCLTPRTRAVILVHLYGQVRDLDAWERFADDKGIDLIEDCAQSHLAKWSGRGCGTFGRAGAFSFYPTKNLGAIGDGGAIVTNDGDLALKAARLRNYGQSARYYHPELGMNSRLDELQAAILYTRLSWLEKWTLRRQEIAHAYYRGLSNPAVHLLQPPAQSGSHVFHLFAILCDRRDNLAAHLETCGVQTLIHYPVPIHNQRPCLNIARAPGGLDSAERHARTCLSIPIHPQMSDSDVATVIDAVNSFSV